MTDTFSISDFIILTTLTDGLPYRYLETSLVYNGQLRRMTVFFSSKLDRDKLELGKAFRVSGILQDDGESYGLILGDAKIAE